MPATIAVLSQKGGTGKTTVVRSLADVLRRHGIRTLAVDLDPQGNLSDYFGLAAAEPTIADVLSGRVRALEAVSGDLIPAGLPLAELELLLVGTMGRELRLRRALAEVRDDYELTLIDCPPSLGLLTVNALVAADFALISAEPQYFSLRGIEQAMKVVELAKDTLNPELALLGLLLNRANMRTIHSRAALAALRERYGASVFGTVVRSSIAYAETAQSSRSILDHRADLGRDYVALASEVLDRLPPAARPHKPPLTHARELALAHPQAPSTEEGYGRRGDRLPAFEPCSGSVGFSQQSEPSVGATVTTMGTETQTIGSAALPSGPPFDADVEE